MEEGCEVWRSMGGWTSKLGWGVHGCDLWRDSCMGWEEFCQSTWLEIRVEKRVRFWQDSWCGDQPLQVTSLVSYEISINKEAYVEASLTRQGVGRRGLGMFVSFEI